MLVDYVIKFAEIYFETFVTSLSELLIFQPVPVFPQFHPMKKGHPLRNILQKTITRSGEGGLYMKWASDLELAMKSRGQYIITKHTLKPLKVKDVIPAFYILVIGWSAATIAFVCELIYSTRCLNNGQCFNFCSRELVSRTQQSA